MSSNSETPLENNTSITEKLEKLREEILSIEKKLAEYGFEPRRGIESYKISELRDLIARAGSSKNEVKKLIVKLVELQEKLYRELYQSAGLKELKIDTDTPEKRLLIIKEWLLTGKVNTTTPSQTRFKVALRKIIEILKECDSDCKEKILDALKTTYKRDYDRYRVLKFLLEICRDCGGIDKSQIIGIESKSIKEMLDLFYECVLSVGKNKLLAHIRFRGDIK